MRKNPKSLARLFIQDGAEHMLAQPAAISMAESRSYIELIIG
jgi:hypothetical protein